MLPFHRISRILKQTRPFIRQKHAPDHWSVLRKKNHPVDKALAHFDDFYLQVFGKKWESIRRGLLGKQKYVAVVNNYADNEQTMAKFELQGALNVRTLFNLEKGYNKDKKRKRERSERLKEIHKLDEELEEKIKKTDFSLKSSLENAEIDVRRIIDANDALSGEILHEFVPATKIKGKEDFIPESSHYQYYQPGSFTVKVETERDFKFPEHLNVYCFEEESEMDWDPAKMGSTGVLNYYLMDGGSILPVLALGVEPYDRILDMCGGPGGKSLLMIQTLYPNCVVSNDVSGSRTNRIYSVAKQFLYDLEERWIKTGRLKITRQDGRFINSEEFDRVLVDVPCTTDRHSLIENDNNIFKPSRIKERLRLPELQCQLLVNALKLVRKGGTVVYSTCSLSPIQNDGVVHMALKQIWEETNLEIIALDLTPAMVQTKCVFKLANSKIMKYGHLVVPDLSQNYGPTYFCKLKRIK